MGKTPVTHLEDHILQHYKEKKNSSRELRQKLDKKSDEMDKLHRKITDAIDEEELSHTQHYASPTRLGETTAGRLSMEDLGNTDEEESFRPGEKFISLKIHALEFIILTF